MKKLISLFFAVALFGAFSVSAFGDTGVDHVSTDGAICGEREAGKAVKDSDKEKSSEENTAVQN